MVFTLVVAGIAVLLLLLGIAIPQLRGMATETRDIETPDGLSVSIILKIKKILEQPYVPCQLAALL